MLARKCRSSAVMEMQYTGAISRNVHLASRGYLCPLASDGLEMMERLALRIEGNLVFERLGT